ncbi:enoyl-CoA hydratase-related protein, partial [Oceaniglobus roseus]|uniref:enoyl-CoA hydratase-related protein n=1 Tax=Oceaniglobus roseus TaxID=1737570 RepID=UPI001FE40983
MSDVRMTVEDGVAVLTLDAPPTNTLDAPLCTALAEALEKALGDDLVHAVILAAEGPEFSTGTAPGWDGAGLRRLVARIGAAGKPVIAALHGRAEGDGLELALAAHYRTATQGVRPAGPGI